MQDFEIESLEQLLAVALATERDAVERYSAISKQMQDGGSEELVELFADIAQEERGHVKEIEKIIHTLGIENPPDVPGIAWQHPKVQDLKELATSPRTSTPYLALAYAVNTEDLAFRFYSYVAANTEDEEIRKFAEAFAKEELSHASMFRERRRRAFHEQRKKTKEDAIPAPDRIHSVAGLLAASAQIERSIHRLLAIAKDLGMNFSDSLLENRARIEETGVVLSGSTPETDRLRDSDSELTRETVSREIAAAVERAFEFYDRVTETSQDEEIMLKAQELTQLALDRIKSLQESA